MGIKNTGRSSRGGDLKEAITKKDGGHMEGELSFGDAPIISGFCVRQGADIHESIDVSEQWSGPESMPFAPGSDYIYIGYKDQFSTVVFKGIENFLESGLIAVEYWNGSEWAKCYMSSMMWDAPNITLGSRKIFHFPYAPNLAIRLGTYAFDGTKDWSTLECHGHTKYFIRFKRMGCCDNTPTIKGMELRGSGGRISPGGHIEHFGGAQPYESQTINMFLDAYGRGAYNYSVRPSKSTGLSVMNSLFKNRRRSGAGFVYSVPANIDISKGCIVTVGWNGLSGGRTGNVCLKLYQCEVPEGEEAIKSKLPELVAAKDIAVPEVHGE